MASDAFGDLLGALNTFIDDSVDPFNEFHRFTDLPLELRHQLYEQYFIEDVRALSCYEWPSIHFHIPHGKRWKKSAAFLPNLCLTDRMFGSEAAAYLVGSARCMFSIKPMVLPVYKKARVSNIFHMIKKATLSDIDLVVRRMASSNKEDNILDTLFDDILSSLFNIRELSIIFPRIQCMWVSAELVLPGTYPTAWYDDFLQDRIINPILGMKLLQKVVVEGIDEPKNSIAAWGIQRSQAFSNSFQAKLEKQRHDVKISVIP